MSSGHVVRRTRWMAWGVVLLASTAVFSATVVVDAGPARAGTPVPGAAGCPMFPSGNVGPVRIELTRHSPVTLDYAVGPNPAGDGRHLRVDRRRSGLSRPEITC